MLWILWIRVACTQEGERLVFSTGLDKRVGWTRSLMFLCQKLERTSKQAPSAYSNTALGRSALDYLPSEDELLACMTSLGKSESERKYDAHGERHNPLSSCEYPSASERLGNKETSFWTGLRTADEHPGEWETVGQPQEHVRDPAQSVNGYVLFCTENGLDTPSFDQCLWTKWDSDEHHLGPKIFPMRRASGVPDFSKGNGCWGSEDFKGFTSELCTPAITSGGAETFNNRDMNHAYTPRSSSHSMLTDTAVENMMNTLNLKNVTDPILLFQSLMGFKEHHCKDLMAAICESGTSFGTIVGAYLHNIAVMSADSLAPSGKLAGTLAKAVASRYRNIFEQSGSSTNTITSCEDMGSTLNSRANQKASRAVKFGSMALNRNGDARMGKKGFSEPAQHKASIECHKGATARFFKKGQLPLLPRAWQRKNNNRSNGADICARTGCGSNQQAAHAFHRVPRSDREPRSINTTGFHPKNISTPQYHRQVVW